MSRLPQWTPGAGVTPPLPVACPRGHEMFAVQLDARDSTLQLAPVDLRGRPYVGVVTDLDGDEPQSGRNAFAEPDRWSVYCPRCGYSGKHAADRLQALYVAALNHGLRRVSLTD